MLYPRTCTAKSFQEAHFRAIGSPVRSSSAGEEIQCKGKAVLRELRAKQMPALRPLAPPRGALYPPKEPGTVHTLMLSLQ